MAPRLKRVTCSTPTISKVSAPEPARERSEAKARSPRRQAELDIEAAFEYYLAEAGADVAIGFVDALEQAVTTISRNPAIGSPRYAHELDLPGLRSGPLKRFPYLIFYVEFATHLEIWRILHSHRDIPASLQDPDDF